MDTSVVCDVCRVLFGVVNNYYPGKSDYCASPKMHIDKAHHRMKFSVYTDDYKPYLADKLLSSDMIH